MNLKHAALAVALLCLTTGPASPIGFGEMGQHFGKEGADIIPNAGGGGGGCNMTGIFDITNTCNNIYYLGRTL